MCWLWGVFSCYGSQVASEAFRGHIQSAFCRSSDQAKALRARVGEQSAAAF